MIRTRSLFALLFGVTMVVSAATVGGAAFGQDTTPTSTTNGAATDLPSSQQMQRNDTSNDTGGWDAPRADAGATGATNDDGPRPYGNSSWGASERGEHSWGPAIAGDSVVMAYAGEEYPNGVVESYNETTGETEWHQENVGNPLGPATTANGTVFVATKSDTSEFTSYENRTGMYALDAESGDVVWRVNGTFAPPVAAGGHVFTSERPYYYDRGDGYGNVTAIDPATGERIWTSDVQGKVVAAADGRLVVTDAPSDTLYVVDAEDGSLRWKTGVDDGAYLQGDIAATDDAVYVTNRIPNAPDYDETPKTVTAYAAADGSRMWETEVESGLTAPDNNPYFLSAPAVANGSVYVVTDDGSAPAYGEVGTVHSLDADTGETEWRFRTYVDLHSDPAVANGTVYAAGMYQFQEEWAYNRSAYDVADWRGPFHWLTAYAIDADTGEEQWSLMSGSGGSNVHGPYASAAADERVYFTWTSQGLPGSTVLTTIGSTEDRPPWYFHPLHDQTFQASDDGSSDGTADGSGDGTDEGTTSPDAQVELAPPAGDDGYYDRNTTVTLNASQSTDEDGEIVAYEWDVDDDGEYETTGVTATVTTDELACVETTVTLRVTDDDGNTDTVTRTLQTQPDDS